MADEIDNGGEQGGEGGQQTAGGATVIDEGGEGQQQQTPAWDVQPLPQGHWGHEKGFKTWGDVDKGYRSSSEEARRFQSESQAMREQNEKITEALLQHVMQRPGQQGPGATQKQAEQNWLAKTFGNREAYHASLKSDYEGTLQKAMLEAFFSAPDAQERLLKMLQPAIGEFMQPIQQTVQGQQQQAFQAQAEGIFSAWAKENPDFAPGTDGYKALDHALRTDPTLKELAQRDYPRALRLAASEIGHATTKQQLKAANVRAGETRKAAVSAGVGSGANGQPMVGDPIEQSFRKKVAEAVAAGEVWTEEDIQAGLQRIRGITGGNKKRVA